MGGVRDLRRPGQADYVPRRLKQHKRPARHFDPADEDEKVNDADVRAGRCDALMAHWRLVSPRLVRALGEAGGDLYVWTVDDAARIRRLEALGVTGVITNDPRLFAVAQDRPAARLGLRRSRRPRR